MQNFIRRSGLLIMALFLFSSCAHLGSKPASKESLTRDVEKVWNAKLNQDWGVVYDMAVQKYKTKVNKTAFLKRANIVVKEYTIKDLKILDPGKKAISVVDYKISHAGYEFPVKNYKEEWLWEEGAWHLNLLPTLSLPIIEQKSQQK